jgi:spoIIIJ-associated protein
MADSIELTADTVEQAVKEALEQLGAHHDDVSIEVLATPRAGVLGLGSRQARVRVVRRDSPAGASGVQSPPLRTAAIDAESASRKSAGLEEQGREATAILKQLLELMGERAEVRPTESDSESVELEIRGDGSGILIGRHGQTLDALEYVVNRILARRIKDSTPISLETESYRARRRQQLHRMALSMGERAKREHEPVKLDPMPPRDRRVVHLALKDDPLITTRSAGEGFLRSIEIVPAAGGNRERAAGPGPQGRGRRRDRDRDRDPDRQREPDRQPDREREPDRQPDPDNAIGEHGGFKHGQKRIV